MSRGLVWRLIHIPILHSDVIGIQDILNEIINQLNDQVDETNSELDYEPPMMEMGMEDLKQKHYDHPSFDSCKKASSASGTVYKATILAQQDGIVSSRILYLPHFQLSKDLELGLGRKRRLSNVQKMLHIYIWTRMNWKSNSP